MPHYLNLDIARGLAALLVCVSHIRAFLFVDWGKIDNPSFLDAGAYFLTGLGHSSVVIFFVLSGFFVGGRTIADCRERRFSFRQYAINRLSRLYTVLIPALLITALLDTLGAAITGGYDISLVASQRSNGPLDHSVTTLLGNLFFLQTIYVPYFGTNGGLWSLANEFWYYAIFPLGCMSYFGTRRWIFGALALGLAIWLPSVILIAAISWLLGAFTHGIKYKPSRIYVVVSWLIFVGAICATFRWHTQWMDCLLALSFCLLIPVLLRPGLFQWSAFTKLADMSYSLYLVHGPFIAFSWYAIMGAPHVQPTAHGYSLFAILLLACLGFAFTVWWVFERRTPDVKGFLKRKFS